MARRQAASRRFQFQKRRQLLIGVHNEALSVIAVRIRNPDCSPAEVYSCNAAPTPTGFAEIVSDDRTIPLPKCRMIRHNSRRAAAF
jgi:hypothetical protein